MISENIFFWLQGLAQFVIVPPKNFRLEGVTRFVMGTIMGSVNYFWNSIHVMGMSEGTKKFLTRRACSIRHCTPKKFLARRGYPICHGYNYGLGKLFFGTQYTLLIVPQKFFGLNAFILSKIIFGNLIFGKLFLVIYGKLFSELNIRHKAL